MAVQEENPYPEGSRQHKKYLRLKKRLERSKAVQASLEGEKKPGVLTSGQKKGAQIKLGFDAGLAGIKAIMRQRSINRQKRRLAAAAKALKAPTITEGDLAAQKAIESAAMREAKASTSRGGGSGYDQSQIDSARDAALKKYAVWLTKRQKSELDKKQEIGKLAQEQSKQLEDSITAQQEGIATDVSNILKDKGTRKAFYKAGETERERLGRRAQDRSGKLEKKLADRARGTV